MFNLLQIDTLQKAANTLPAPEQISLWSLLEKGGWIMYPLYLLLVVAIFVFIERLLAIRKASRIEDNFMNIIRDHIITGNVTAARSLSKNTNNPVARMIDKGLQRIGKPIDAILIDFQGSYWGSPSGDLIYFLITSIHDDFKVNHFDNLVEFYHGELVTSLKKLKYDKPIPTSSELHVDIQEMGYFTCMCIMFILFICKYDDANVMSIDTVMNNDDEAARKMMKTIYKI